MTATLCRNMWFTCPYQEIHEVSDGGSIPSRGKDRISLFTTAFRQALGPTPPSIQWVPGSLSLRGWIGRGVYEADHSYPYSVEVKNAWSYNPTPPIRPHGMVISYVQGQLYFNLHEMNA
jgi:hypothetical protein